MSKTFYKIINCEPGDTTAIINSIPSSIAYDIAQFCGKEINPDYIPFTKNDITKLREYYRLIRTNKSEFSTSTTTVGRVTFCGNDANYILDILTIIGKTLHTHKVFVN